MRTVVRDRERIKVKVVVCWAYRYQWRLLMVPVETIEEVEKIIEDGAGGNM